MLSQLFSKDRLRPILFISIVIHFAAVIFSEGYHRPDEHLGIIRWMGHLLGIVPESILSWEYPAQIRPWLQPLFYAAFLKPFLWLKISNPFFLAFMLRLISSSIFFLCAIPLIRFLKKTISQIELRNLSYILLLLLWYFPFFHARTTNENVASSIFMLAFGLFINRVSEKNKKHALSWKMALGIGFILGVSFILRFQMAFMIIGLIAWPLFFFKVGRIKVPLLLTLGIILCTAASTLLDRIGYGEWTFTPWNYFYENIVNKRAAGFGVDPWWKYISKTFSRGVFPISILMLAGYAWLWIKRPLSLLTWITLPFFVLHSAVAHKELRFIFALGLFFPFFVGDLIEWTKRIPKLNTILCSKALIWILIVENSLLLIISSVKPAFSQMGFYKHLYHHEEKITSIVTLSVFRDQLRFYLPRDIEQIHEPNIQNIENHISNGQEWFLLNTYDHYQYLEKMPNCRRDFSSYPDWMLNIGIVNKKRSKTWWFYRCTAKMEQ